MNENESTTENDTTNDSVILPAILIAGATCAAGYYAGKAMTNRLRARSRGLRNVYLITTMR